MNDISGRILHECMMGSYKCSIRLRKIMIIDLHPQRAFHTNVSTEYNLSSL